MYLAGPAQINLEAFQISISQNQISIFPVFLSLSHVPGLLLIRSREVWGPRSSTSLELTLTKQPEEKNMSFKNLKKIDIFRPKTPDEDFEDYEDFKTSVENSQRVIFSYS